ncbi:hypothetical protein WMY93_020942 [Mugilogobius chulae]|uniref:Annexin n=1 Tax=Mugilogobius chulae TaxID=88201 RepID=A0AAW0NE68_9GOBI
MHSPGLCVELTCLPVSGFPQALGTLICPPTKNLQNDLDLFLDSSNSGGTVKDSPNFKVDEDVAALRKALEGRGTDEKTLIEILTQRSNAQRQRIAQAYEKETGKGLGTRECALTEIFASRSNKQIKALSEAYSAATGKALLEDLKGEVTGEYGKALLILAEGKRDESIVVNAGKAKADAKALYEAGEKKKPDEDIFIDILCHRSVPQLRQTFVDYKEISTKTLQETIEVRCPHLEKLLVAVVKCVKSVPAYLAERLFKSMKGLGTTESVLNRIIVGRSEVDLLDIRAEYKKRFEHSLYTKLESEVSGCYGDVLKRLCGQD